MKPWCMILELYLKSIHFNWDILLNTTEKFIGHCVQHNRKTFDLLHNSLWIILHNEKHSIVFVYLLIISYNNRWEILKEMGMPDHITCSWETSMQVKKQQNWTWNKWLVQNWKRNMTRLSFVSLLISLICRVHHVKCQAGWIASWNQECQEKYQQPQICRWYPSSGRKWRGTKEFLDRVERGELKSWLGTQH